MAKTNARASTLLVASLLLSACTTKEEPKPEADPTLEGRVIPVFADPSSKERGPLEKALEGARLEGQAKALKAEESPAAKVTSPPLLVPPPVQPAPPSPEEPRFVEGEVLVRLRPGALDAISTLHERPELEAYRFELGPWASPEWVVLVLRPRGEPEARISAEETKKIVPLLEAQPEFSAVELNHLRHTDAAVNDTLYPRMWSLHQLAMERAWEIATGSEEVVVAVLDDGIKAHTELEGRLLPGYDMIADPDFAGDGDGRDPDPSPIGSDEHGLNVAGTIAANTNNNYGIAGMDWGAKILPVRVANLEGARRSDTVAGIYWAIGAEIPGLPVNPHPADVINLSLGGSLLVESEQEAVDAALAAGAIVVVSAGNDDDDASRRSFSGYEGVIVVGATDYLGHRAYYSNWGHSVDVMAPGGDMRVDRNADGLPDGIFTLTYPGLGTDTTIVQGTSFSAPYVSGLVALMKSIKPDLNHEEALSILKATADPAGQCSQGCGAGLVDPARALQETARLATSAPPLLHVDIDRIDLGELRSSSLVIENRGGLPLSWTAGSKGSLAARVRLSKEAGELAGGEKTALEVSVLSDGLETGIHEASIEIRGWGYLRRIPLTFHVGEPDVLDIGPVEVFTVRMDGQGKLIAGSHTRAHSEDGYRFSFTTPPGDWFLVAWSDRNGNQVIDEDDPLALFPDATEPLGLDAGERREGLELALRIAPDPEQQKATPPCANLRRCWESCAGIAACENTCRVDEACLECYREIVRPCQRAAECEQGVDCCGSCGGELDACFGEGGCELTIPWNGGGIVGSRCSSSEDCMHPYNCDTSVPGGMCTRRCQSHGDCPGGSCVTVQEDAAYCLVSCAGGGCPRPQDECAKLTNGGSACFP